MSAEVSAVKRAELVEVLRDAGLSPYQADAYVTTLEFGAAPVTDIAEVSDVPDPRIYDVLRDLDEEGYIELYEQESLHARAYSFETVTEDLETRASRFREAAEEIERRWEQPAMQETSVSIVGQFETVIKNAAEWIRAADDRVQVSLCADQYDRLQPALSEAVDAGVDVYLSVHANERFFERTDVATVCTEARNREIPSPFVTIVDRTRSCFAPHEGSSNEYGVLVDDRTHTYVFHWFFLTTQWDVWNPFYVADDDGEFPTDYVDVRYCVRDIAPLLDAGATVRVRASGIDLESDAKRTVEGRVSELLLSDAARERVPRDIATYGGQVGLVIETDDGPVTVGGWGAMVEELEAPRVTVVAIEE
jgi:sugar-specific transcriptional regulator TrmB